MITKERCVSGIEVLDSELHGGIPVGSTVLISGGSGVGKTTLSMQFLANGASMGEKGVFFTASETLPKLKRFQGGFNFFDEVVRSWNLSSTLTGILYIGILVILRELLTLPFSIIK